MILTKLLTVTKIIKRNMHNLTVIDTATLESTSQCLVPKLTEGKHKGQAGRIGVVGGSLEYTGAPYFSAISSLKVGADIVHIFCQKEAAPVIKSYSPELIVHPILDKAEAIEEITPWLARLHVLVIGPGLGRDVSVFGTVEKLIKLCRTMEKPLVIDADGLFLIASKPDLIKDYPGVVLTPNAIEYSRLPNSESESSMDDSQRFVDVEETFGNRCIIVKKGQTDEIFDASSIAVCSVKGSARRCGGQGDLLSGALAVFYYWSTLRTNSNSIPNANAITACYAACKLTRKCNEKAFSHKGRSMTTSDMILEIGSVFAKNFETE